MATSNTQISYIPSTNVGISDANVLRNLLDETKYNTPNSSLKGLRDWFSARVGARGRANDETLNNGSISLGNFGENYIYGFSVAAKPESFKDRYQDKNDGSITFTPLYGISSSQVFTFGIDGRDAQTSTRGNSITFGNMSGKPDNPYVAPPTKWSLPGSSNDYLDYGAYVYHRNTNDKISFTIRIGYSGIACRLKYGGSVDDDISSARSYLVGTTLYRFGEKPGSKPLAPSGLTAALTTPNSILLEWGPVYGADRYEVYRSSTLIGTVTTASYQDTGLTSNTNYSYSVKAINDYGDATSTARTFKTNPLTTKFKMLLRVADSNLTNDAASTDTWTSLILDDYTDYSYTFNVTMTPASGSPVTGNYVCKTYDDNIALSDTINYKTLSGNSSETAKEYTSIKLNTITATPRAGGAASTFNIGRTVSFTADGVEVSDAGSTTNPVQFEAVSTDYIEIDDSYTNTGLFTNELVFNLGMNLDSTPKEKLTLTVANEVKEKSVLTLNTLTYNPSGSYYWKINRITTDNGEFVSESGLLGAPSNTTGKSSAIIIPVADSAADSPETFTVSIHKGSNSGTQLAISDTITLNEAATAAYNETLTFDIRQLKTNRWVMYISGTVNRTYLVHCSDGSKANYSSTERDYTFKLVNPTTNINSIRMITSFLDPGWKDAMFKLKMITLLDSSDRPVKTWDIQKEFFTKKYTDTETETSTKFTITNDTGFDQLPNATYTSTSNTFDSATKIAKTVFTIKTT